MSEFCSYWRFFSTRWPPYGWLPTEGAIAESRYIGVMVFRFFLLAAVAQANAMRLAPIIFITAELTFSTLNLENFEDFQRLLWVARFCVNLHRKLDALFLRPSPAIPARLFIHRRSIRTEILCLHLPRAHAQNLNSLRSYVRFCVFQSPGPLHARWMVLKKVSYTSPHSEFQRAEFKKSSNQNRRPSRQLASNFPWSRDSEIISHVWITVQDVLLVKWPAFFS